VVAAAADGAAATREFEIIIEIADEARELLGMKQFRSF
jgi:hypothetical protein